MPWRFTPRSASFSMPIKEATQTVAAAARAVRDVIGGASSERARAAARLQDAAQRSRQHRKDLLRQVDDTFVPPMDRRDLVAIIQGLDECVARMEFAGDLAHQLQVPQAGVAALTPHADLLVLLADLLTGDPALLLRPSDAASLSAELRRLPLAAGREYREQVVKILEPVADPLPATRTVLVLDRLQAAAEAFAAVGRVIEAAARSGH